jgi:hypothetical protein
MQCAMQTGAGQGVGVPWSENRVQAGCNESPSIVQDNITSIYVQVCVNLCVCVCVCVSEWKCSHW